MAQASEHSEFLERLSLRGSVQAALFTSTDQIGRMHYDRVGLLGDLQLGVLLWPWLSLDAGATGGGFWASHDEPTGGLLAPLFGLRALAPARKVSPFVALMSGPAFTGDLTRPLLRISVGCEFGLGAGVGLGPVLGYGQVFQHNGEGFSTDGRYLFAGLVIGYRPWLRPPPKPVVIRQTSRTVERYVERVETSAPAPAQNDRELFQLIESALPAPEERVELLAPVLFAFDSDELEPVGVAMLHEVARLLRERADIELVAIRAYADSRGSAEYNRELAQRRAERVRAWLTAHDIADSRLVCDAQGATDFVEPGKSEVEHEQNRRVVFRVLRMKEP